MTKLQENLNEGLRQLHELVRLGVPLWLRNSFEPGPLQNLLEKQRMGLADDYQTQLDEVRALYEQVRNDARAIPSDYIEGAIASYALLQELSKQSKRLTAHLDSHRGRQEDFEAWRKVSQLAVEVSQVALSAFQVYGYAQFQEEAEQLWRKLYSRFVSQPLSFLSSHKAVQTEIDALRQKISHWLESRREEFEAQRALYEELLATVHIPVVLRVPFDRDKPRESQAALIALVLDHLYKHFAALEATLRNALQTIRYSIQVQKLALSEAEIKTNRALSIAASIKEQINSEVVSDTKRFQQDLLSPLRSLIGDMENLETEVQRAIQQRPAEGEEVKLMGLFQGDNAGQDIDLRELIMMLIDQREGPVELSVLMRDIQSLFQKNLVDIHIKQRARSDTHTIASIKGQSGSIAE